MKSFDRDIITVEVYNNLYVQCKKTGNEYKMYYIGMDSLRNRIWETKHKQFCFVFNKGEGTLYQKKSTEYNTIWYGYMEKD